MTEYLRTVESDITKTIYIEGKVNVLYGPRQSGKTTLAKKILKDLGEPNGYFACDSEPVNSILESLNPAQMYQFFGDKKLIVLDEAQTVTQIGLALKVFIDAFPKSHILATGSSSFDLANKLSEPLTGRHFEYFLPPISFEESIANEGADHLIESLDSRMLYGGYPEVLFASGESAKLEALQLLSSSYLYKDVLQFGNIRRPDILDKILKALAFQIGGEVSQSEIASLVGIDKNTVASYITLLEQAFVIFSVRPLALNPRSEAKKLKKIYFLDNGILNVMRDRFSRNISESEQGALWENLMMSERFKFLRAHSPFTKMHYWRKTSGAEVDYIEASSGLYTPFEFKFSKPTASPGSYAFQNQYPTTAPLQIITKSNFLPFTTSNA